mmetsp:Transcript_1184/g.3279  ORF Transcript_1184/g.3279 Transcript_1184/m.3279 type:complete len:253 (-) Transcript_1184:627-1385(-)
MTIPGVAFVDLIDQNSRLFGGQRPEHHVHHFRRRIQEKERFPVEGLLLVPHILRDTGIERIAGLQKEVNLFPESALGVDVVCRSYAPLVRVDVGRCGVFYHLVVVVGHFLEHPRLLGSLQDDHSRGVLRPRHGVYDESGVGQLGGGGEDTLHLHGVGEDASVVKEFGEARSRRSCDARRKILVRDTLGKALYERPDRDPAEFGVCEQVRHVVVERKQSPRSPTVWLEPNTSEHVLGASKMGHRTCWGSCGVV